MPYNDYNDNELLSYIAENNEQASLILFKKYDPLIVSIATNAVKKNPDVGLDINDLIQDGRLALNNAIVTYNETHNVIFYSYARVCIERAITTSIIKANRLKHKHLNDSFSLDSISEEYGKNDFFMIDNRNNPELKILDFENKQEIYDIVQNKFTDFETSVFELKVKGFNYEEIAMLLNKDKKSIDNAIQRIRKKLSEFKNAS